MNMCVRLLWRATVTSIVLFVGLASAEAQVTSSIHADEITLKSRLLTIDYHTQTGRMDAEWHDGQRLKGIESAVQLADGRELATSAYTTHTLESHMALSGKDGVTEFTIVSRAEGKPPLLQHVRIAADKPWFSVQLELDAAASAVGTRHINAVRLAGDDAVTVKPGASLRVLHVPFDNDMWFRYDSEPVQGLTAGKDFTSSEVTAVYDNASRAGFVLGSIDHDVWKTAIDVRVDSGKIRGLDIYGGIALPTGVRTDTHDTLPHGVVSGRRVTSPRVLIGSFADWRDGLETYGAVNAAVHPSLHWAGPVPMGWNSWAAYADKIDYDRYLGAAAYVHDTLLPQGFGKGRVVYINLDAFWSRLDAVQLADAVATIKAMRAPDGTRFEPGIYWTPFAYWSDNLDAIVEGTHGKYRYRDILLKAPDGSLLPKVDGGRPIDPTHPGEIERIRFTMQQFAQMGFQYLKIDFLSHGALEGKHYDPAVQTGIEAYNKGMQEIAKAADRRIFLSLSIAPLFPSGYGNARRLSCDTKGHIDGDQSTEYMLNSLTYGWWTSGNLYIADPDHVVLGENADLGARNVTEGRSRLLSAIISGGMILDSSRLADDPQGRELARQVYDNPRLFAVASEGKVFRPIEGDTGDRAAAAFVRKTSSGYYLALFNYDAKNAKTIDVPLERIDPSLRTVSGAALTDVASGEGMPSVHGTIAISLSAGESKLIEVRPQR
ncbi:hypothetical protein ESZ00_09680 [Silvibacterium dinghuense]|uniref:Alpha-galactosidase n=2 Tax=Silvibacterium dinghuense TaxID=1560006 RepID=A0A4Q1SCD7_9BACT|nr:hypothetical protein [Silvibacterium dinghuense]RXS94902.1 hypothetical protein ESZ00_09680 [Silvibacterium dinghuense]